MVVPGPAETVWVQTGKIPREENQLLDLSCALH